MTKKHKHILTLTLILTIIVGAVFTFSAEAVIAQKTTAKTPPPAQTTKTTKAATKQQPTQQQDSQKKQQVKPKKGNGPIDRLGSVIVQLITSLPATILYLLTAVVGKALIATIAMLVDISQYNNFINSKYVTTGWVIVRDLVNMFFIIGLLFISFGTVLKVQAYNWQKLLPRLIIMAILVNFSRILTGIVIDFFQIIMITFVNAYKDVAGKFFHAAFSLDKIPRINPDVPISGAIDNLGGQLFGLIFLIVSLVVIFMFLGILLMRIVAIWIFIVFSPLAFFSWIFSGSGIGSFFDKWKKGFVDYLIIGPFLAFFLWLSIATASQLQDNLGDFTNRSAEKRAELNVTASLAGTFDSTLSFIISIVMLVAGLKFSSEFKVAGGAAIAGFADRVIERGRRVGRAVTVAPLAKVGEVATRPARALGSRVTGLARGAVEAKAERLRTEGITAPTLAPAGTKRAALLKGLGRSLTEKGREDIRARAIAQGKGLGERGEKTAQLQDYEKRAEEFGKTFEAQGRDLKPDDMRRERDTAIREGNIEKFLYFNKKLAGTKTWNDSDSTVHQDALKRLGFNEPSRIKYSESLEKLEGMEGQAISDLGIDENTGEVFEKDRELETKNKIANITDRAQLQRAFARKANIDPAISDAKFIAARLEGEESHIEDYGKAPKRVRQDHMEKLDYFAMKDDANDSGRKKIYDEKNFVISQGNRLKIKDAEERFKNMRGPQRAGESVDEYRKRKDSAKALSAGIEKYNAKKSHSIEQAKDVYRRIGANYDELSGEKAVKAKEKFKKFAKMRQAWGKEYHGNGREKTVKEGGPKVPDQLGSVFANTIVGKDIIRETGGETPTGNRLVGPSGIPIRRETTTAAAAAEPKTPEEVYKSATAKAVAAMGSRGAKADVRMQQGGISGNPGAQTDIRSYVKQLEQSLGDLATAASKAGKNMNMAAINKDMGDLGTMSIQIGKEGGSMSDTQYSELLSKAKAIENNIKSQKHISAEAASSTSMAPQTATIGTEQQSLKNTVGELNSELKKLRTERSRMRAGAKEYKKITSEMTKIDDEIKDLQDKIKNLS